MSSVGGETGQHDDGCNICGNPCGPIPEISLCRLILLLILVLIVITVYVIQRNKKKQKKENGK